LISLTPSTSAKDARRYPADARRVLQLVHRRVRYP
jgi:hypothetical protein